jgi:hypothetical protein
VALGQGSEWVPHAQCTCLERNEGQSLGGWRVLGAGGIEWLDAEHTAAAAAVVASASGCESGSGSGSEHGTTRDGERGTGEDGVRDADADAAQLRHRVQVPAMHWDRCCCP